MDAARRGSRMVIDPKVCQVGFVTPGGSEAQPKPLPAVDAAVTEEGAAANSPSPIMILPPRHAPDNLVVRAVPMPMPGPVLTIIGHSDKTMLPGSYNPTDSILGTSPSSRNDTERVYITLSSEEMNEDRVSPRWIVADSNPSPRMPHGVASVPSSSMEFANMRPSVPGGSFAAASSLPPIATMPTEKLAGGEDDSKQKPLKERTSKAERRALQEAQRAAKASAKVTGGNKGGDGGPLATVKEVKIPKRSVTVCNPLQTVRVQLQFAEDCKTSMFLCATPC